MNPWEQTLSSQAHSSGAQPRERAPSQGPSAAEKESTGPSEVACHPSTARMPSCLLPAVPGGSEREESEGVKRPGPVLGTHLASVHGGWVLYRCQGR